MLHQPHERRSVPCLPSGRIIVSSALVVDRFLHYLPDILTSPVDSRCEMQSFPIRPIFCSLGAILLVACSAPSDPATVADPFERVAGATIDGLMDEPITLTGGAWLGEPYVEGAASRAGVVLLEEPIAVGDLDDDGDDEIVAVLVLNKGGSGAFVYLAVVDLSGDGARSLATTMLGDRVQVRALSTSDGRIVVDTTEHGPDDAMCCPTHERQHEFEVADGELRGTPLTVRYRGHVSIGHEVRSFTECGTEGEAWLFDLTDGDLRAAHEQLTSEQYEPLFVEVVGAFRAAPDTGFGAGYEAAIEVTELRRAAREGLGCDEDLTAFRLRARGNEPSWRLDVRDDSLALSTMDAGEIGYTIENTEETARGIAISGFDGGVRIDVSLIGQRCIDTMSGSWFPFTATITKDDKQLLGCASEGQ